MIEMDFFEHERALIERRRALGIVGTLPRNDGSRRTESKRQLLRAMAESAEARSNADAPSSPSRLREAPGARNGSRTM